MIKQDEPGADRCDGARLPPSRSDSAFCLLSSSAPLHPAAFIFHPFLLCLLTTVFCLQAPLSFAQATRPVWAWDAESSDTNRAIGVEQGPFQWAWQKEAAARQNPVPEVTPRLPGAGGADAFEGVVRENVVLRREVERALRQLHESRQAQAALEVQVRDLDQKRIALAASLREVRTADEVLAELALIRAERDSLKHDNDRLKERLESGATPTSPPPPPVTPPPGSDLFKKIEQENLELKVELASLKQTAREAEAARIQLENWKREQGSLVEQTVKEKAELKARLDQLQEGKKTSDRQAQVAEKEAQTLRERVAEIKRELNMAKESSTPPQKAATSVPAPSASELSLLQAAGGISPGTDDLTSKALKLAQKGKYRDAEKLYLEALTREPNSAALHFNLGILYQEGLHSSSAAVKHFRKYLELNPKARDADQVRSWINELEMGI